MGSPALWLALLAAAELAASAGTTPHVFHAKDFGAKPNNSADQGPALRRAIDAAVQHGPGAVVELESGVYRIGGSESGPAALNILSARGLTLKGAPGETELIITEPRQGAVYVQASHDVLISGLTVDYDPPPFTQGVVRRANEAKGSFDLDLQEDFPSLAEPWFAEAPRPFGQWGLIIQPDKPVIKPGAPDFIFIDRWEQLDGRRWRLHAAADQRERVSHLEPGDRFVHMARTGGGAIFFSDTRDSGVADVAIHASPALAIGAVATDALTVSRLRVDFRDGTSRLLTTNADGVHCQQNLRGPRVEDSWFEGMADDGINIYYYPNTVRSVSKANELKVSRGGIIEAGDQIQFFEPVEGVVRGTARAAQAAPLEEGGYKLVLAHPVDGVKPDDHAYNLSRCGHGFVIRGNTFRNHRRHGMMIKAPGGIVENNTVSGVGAYAIVIGNDPDWPEGIAPHDVLVRNNHITNVGSGLWYPRADHAAAIQVHGRAEGGRIAHDRIVKRITLEANIIINPPGAGFSIGAAEDIVLAGNTVHFGEGAILEGKKAAVELSNIEGVRIVNLAITGNRDELAGAVRLDGPSALGPLGVRIEDNSVSLPAREQPLPLLVQQDD